MIPMENAAWQDTEPADEQDMGRWLQNFYATTKPLPAEFLADQRRARAGGRGLGVANLSLHASPALPQAKTTASNPAQQSPQPVANQAARQQGEKARNDQGTHVQ